MENIVFYVHRTGLLSYFINPICQFLCNKFKITILHLDKRNGYDYASKHSLLYQTVDLSDMSMKQVMNLLKEVLMMEIK